MAGDLAATLADKNEFNLRNNKMKYWIVLSAWLLAASGSLQAAEQKLSQQEEQQLGRSAAFCSSIRRSFPACSAA